MTSFPARRWPTILALVLLMTATGGTAAAAPVINVPPTPHHAPQGTSLDRIAAAITRAAVERDWAVTREGPGSLTASLWVRGRHRAIVRVGFDSVNYWIDYLDSENLDYSEKDLRRAGPRGGLIKGPRIHKNYNRWVETLAKSIEIRAANPPTAATPAPDVVNELPSVADEIEKLDALRQRGVLTRDEFEHQKRKLLGL